MSYGNLLIGHRLGLSAYGWGLFDLAVEVDKNHLISVTHIVDVYFFLTNVLVARALHQISLLGGRNARTACITLDIEVRTFYVDLTCVLASILFGNIGLHGHDFVLDVRAW